MIVRIGLDLVEVQRIEEAIQRAGFLEKILTEHERSLNLNPLRIAGRWAAKEAIAKAVGTHLTWHDVEIHNDDQGAPYATIRPEAFDLTGHALHLSITHERGHAAATAILERL